MKKTKLLTTIFATCITASGLPLITLSGCSCNAGENITCDEKTQRLTEIYATYTFNLKDDLKTKDIAQPIISNENISIWDRYIENKKLILKVSLNSRTNEEKQYKWDLTVKKTDGSVYGTVKDLVLLYEPTNICTLTFSASEGGSITGPTSLTITKGATWAEVKNKVTPVADEGYKFVGWYKDDGSEVKDDTIFLSDTAVRAVFMYDVELVDVTVKQNGDVKGTAPCVKGATFGQFREYYEISEKPELEGWSFDGWFVDTTQINDQHVVSNNETIEAKYTQNCTLTFEATEGATIVGSTTLVVRKGTKWSAVPAEQKPDISVSEGYRGIGWRNLKTGEWYDESSDPTINNNATIRYIAIPNSQIVNVTINTPIESESGTYEFIRNKTWKEFKETYNIHDPSIPQKQFLGWRVNNQPITDGYKLSSDSTTIEAKLVDSESFEYDSWANVVTYANQGLDALKAKYGKTTFVGCEREILLNGMVCKVVVIGENHDDVVDASGQITGKAALTFQLKDVYCDEFGNELYCPTLVSDNEVGRYFNKDQHDFNKMYWCIEGTTSCRWVEKGQTKTSTKYNYSIRMDMYTENEDLSNGLKTVQKQSMWRLDEDYNYKKIKYSCELFAPTITEMAVDVDPEVAEGSAYEYWVQHNTDADRIKHSVKDPSTPLCYATPSGYFPEMTWSQYGVEETGKISANKNKFGLLKLVPITFGFCI